MSDQTCFEKIQDSPKHFSTCIFSFFGIVGSYQTKFELGLVSGVMATILKSGVL